MRSMQDIKGEENMHWLVVSRNHAPLVMPHSIRPRRNTMTTKMFYY
jgi:hypothetical protein